MSGLTQLPYSIYDLANRLVIRSGSTGSAASAFAKVRDGEGIILGEELEIGSWVSQDEQSFAPPQLEAHAATPAEVRAEAGRRLRYTDWQLVRQMETGVPVRPEILAYRQAVRDAVETILAMDPPPEHAQAADLWPIEPTQSSGEPA